MPSQRTTHVASRIPPAWARTRGGAAASARNSSIRPGRHSPELAVEERREADRSRGEREAADHRPACPVRKRQERGGGGADEEERERLQQVGADEAARGARQARPVAAGGDAQHADLRSLTEPRGQHGVEERPDGARRVHGLEVDRAAERRAPCHRAQWLGEREDDERRREERPARMCGIVQSASAQLEGDGDEAGDRRSSDRPGERQTPHHVQIGARPSRLGPRTGSDDRFGHVQVPDPGSDTEADPRVRTSHGLSGKGFLRIAGSTCAVTHTGVVT